VDGPKAARLFSLNLPYATQLRYHESVGGIRADGTLTGLRSATVMALSPRGLRDTSHSQSLVYRTASTPLRRQAKLCSALKSLIGVSERSGQSRPYVRVRIECKARTPCCSKLLGGTNFTSGREAAVQSAVASAASFFEVQGCRMRPLLTILPAHHCQRRPTHNPAR
jgi:hypothetical protein